MQAEPMQTTLELGVPLSEVTFCVVDLETTGGSPVDDAITEIGAVKYRGGERLGSFRSLVDPRRPIPPYVAHLTGIDDRLVSGEPAIEQVLPSFLEFFGGSVFVAHNAGFDLGFLNASCGLLDYPPLPGPPVCTARLARRVVWPDVPNVRLATLSNYFRTRAKPTHRALDDAEACAEVLHGLLDLAGRLGILTMGDLEEAVRARGRPNFGKIRLADDLPHAPGVYLFRGRAGQVLYVGKANDLRTRVKSYFYGDERKKVVNLLEEVRSVDGIRCDGELEALVVEARLIRRYEPKYNRRGKTWRRGAYLALDLTDAWPRLKIVRAPKPGDGRHYLGPFGSSARARLAKEALEETVHHVDGCHHQVRAMRPRRHRPMRRPLRRPHRSRALRRARPVARLLPEHQPGRAPRSARTPDVLAGRGRALRGGGLGPGPAARARGGALEDARRPVDRRGRAARHARRLGPCDAVRGWFALGRGRRCRRRTARRAVSARPSRRARGGAVVGREASPAGRPMRPCPRRTGRGRGGTGAGARQHAGGLVERPSPRPPPRPRLDWSAWNEP